MIYLPQANESLNLAHVWRIEWSLHPEIRPVPVRAGQIAGARLHFVGGVQRDLGERDASILFLYLAGGVS